MPSASKWSKAGPVTDRMIVACIADNLNGIAGEGLRSLNFSMTQSKTYGEGEEAGSVDTIYEWNRVLGKKQKVFVSVMADSNLKAGWLMLAIVHEGFRLLTLVVMTQAHRKREPGQAPSITELADPRSSVFDCVLSYWSALLRPTSSRSAGNRLRLIWGFRGVKNLKDWRSHYPQDELVLTKLTTSAKGAVQRRLRNRIRDMHWPALLATASPVMPKKDGDGILDTFLRLSACRLSSGFAARLHARYSTPSIPRERQVDLLRGQMERLYTIAFILGPSVAPVENRHAGHRKATMGDQVHTMSTLVSASVEIETRRQQTHVKQESGDQSMVLHEVDDDEPYDECDAVPPQPLTDYVDANPARPTTAKGFYRSDWVREQHALGTITQYVSTDVNNQFESAWRQLDEDEKNTYAQMVRRQ